MKVAGGVYRDVHCEATGMDMPMEKEISNEEERCLVVLIMNAVLYEFEGLS